MNVKELIRQGILKGCTEGVEGDALPPLCMLEVPGRTKDCGWLCGGLSYEECEYRTSSEYFMQRSMDSAAL